jgi:hypothetical protein
VSQPVRHITTRPPAWEPLVSARQWLILSHTLRDDQVLADLHVVLGELSPGVRRALLAHLMETLASGVSPVRAVWISLAITGHDVKLRSARARAHQDVHPNHAATVHALRRA